MSKGRDDKYMKFTVGCGSGENFKYVKTIEYSAYQALEAKYNNLKSIAGKETHKIRELVDEEMLTKYKALERKLEIVQKALNNLIKDAKHHQSLHGKNPKKAYSMGRSDTFQWIKECAEEALKQLEEK